MTQPLADVARLLPDLPEWVEIRGMLLAGCAHIIGPVESAPPAFVVLHADGDQAGVVGQASPAAIREAAGIATEMLAVPDDQAWIAHVLPDWTIEPAVLHTLPANTYPQPSSFPAVRFITPSELAGAVDPSDPLCEELQRAHRAGAPIAAVFDGGRPVAFCHAGSITERWWDVAIDTLEPFRRRGFAQQAASFLIAHYSGQGKEPVWGSAQSNPASAALARRLGFEPAGRLLVLSAPARGVDDVRRV